MAFETITISVEEHAARQDEVISLRKEVKRLRSVFEQMSRFEPCDCGCPSARKPLLMKPHHYYLMARDALGVGIDESRDDAQTGQCALAHAKPPNSDADQACCDSVPTPNVEVSGG